MIKLIGTLIDDFFLKKKLSKVRELIEAHVDSGQNSMYWVNTDSEKQNAMNMIRFVRIAFEDGYMASGKYFEAARWMQSNQEAVWQMYLDMKEAAE